MRDVALAKPSIFAKASGVLDLQRGEPAATDRRKPPPTAHVWLVSGWQGDLPPAADKQTIAVPVAARPTARRSPAG